VAGRFIGRFFGRTISDGAAFAIGASTSRTLNPILQEVANAAWNQHPDAPLSPEEAAALDAADQWAPKDAAQEARFSGLNKARYDGLRFLTEEGLDLSQAFEAWRRGLIDDDGFTAALQKARVAPRWRTTLRGLKNVLLTPQQAASAVERGEMDYADAENEAARQGYTAERFRIIERLAGLAPSTDQLVSLRRRGIIDAARMRRGFVQGNVRSEWSDALARLADVLLDPAQLANMVVQGVLPADDARTLAQEVGVSADNFDRLVRLAGNPPGAHEMLDLWNRGEIDESDVDRGLRQSRLKPEWVDAVKKLREHIPTVSDAIRFAVKDVFDPKAVQTFGLDDEFPNEVMPLALHQGIDREQMRWQWMAHWRNVAPTQLFRMRHRDVISDAELDLGLKTADYAPWWRDKLKAITYLTPGRIDTRRMLAAGIITRDQAITNYLHLGYKRADAEQLVRLAAEGAGTTGKDLTLTQLTSEYERGMIDAAEFRTEVENLGYDATEADTLAALAERKRVDRAREQAISTIRTAYVGHRLREPEARAALAERGVPAAAVDAVFVEWNGARAANVKVLTPAQLKALYKSSQISDAEATAELTFRGYSDADAARLIGTWQ
jgi:hypothetical protein